MAYGYDVPVGEGPLVLSEKDSVTVLDHPSAEGLHSPLRASPVHAGSGNKGDSGRSSGESAWQDAEDCQG